MGSTVYDIYDYEYIYNNPKTFYPESTTNPAQTVLENTAYQNFRAVLGYKPSQDQFTNAIAILGSGGIGSLQTYLQSLNQGSITPVVPKPDLPGSSTSPGTNTSTSATGTLAPTTSTEGGTPTSFASQYSPVISAVQVPSVGQPGGSATPLLVLAGLVGLMFFWKK